MITKVQNLSDQTAICQFHPKQRRFEPLFIAFFVSRPETDSTGKPFSTTSPTSPQLHYPPRATLNSPAKAGLLFPCFFSKKQRCSCLTIVRHEHINRRWPFSGFIKAREGHTGGRGLKKNTQRERHWREKKRRRKRKKNKPRAQRRRCPEEHMEKKELNPQPQKTVKS